VIRVERSGRNVPAGSQTEQVKLGILIFPTDLSIRPDRLAVAAEERGFESLWVTEHTHIPTSRRTPWPGGPNLPEEYRRTLDPFVALTSAAAVTSRLRLATGISLVAQHDPIVMAKTIASLDLLSLGRVTLGIGVGWNQEEMADHGVDPARRRAVAREKVLAMKALWTEEEASFEGEFVHFPPAWSWPKPVQQPHPPVVMGGAGGPVTFRHVVEYCDGWMPIHGRRSVLDKLPLLRAAAEDAGRDPASIELGVFGVPGDPSVIDTYRDAGISRCVLGLPSADEPTVLATLDRATDLVAQFT
jgi:probable F420-dependent oxidoreductase